MRCYVDLKFMGMKEVGRKMNEKFPNDEKNVKSSINLFNYDT